jgi:hypothetical protein
MCCYVLFGFKAPSNTLRVPSGFRGLSSELNQSEGCLLSPPHPPFDCNSLPQPPPPPPPKGANSRWHGKDFRTWSPTTARQNNKPHKTPSYATGATCPSLTPVTDDTPAYKTRSLCGTAIPRGRLSRRPGVVVPECLRTLRCTTLELHTHRGRRVAPTWPRRTCSAGVSTFLRCDRFRKVNGKS